MSMYNDMYKGMLEPTCWVCVLKYIFRLFLEPKVFFFVWTYLGLKQTRQDLFKFNTQVRPILMIEN
jgi:hypothetical protein